MSPVMIGLLPVNVTKERVRTLMILLYPSGRISAHPSVIMLSRRSPLICIPLALSMLSTLGVCRRESGQALLKFFATTAPCNENRGSVEC